jgi:hypothetical protein
MNENQIADIWLLFKEYLDKKTLETVADRYVELMADYGVTDKALAGAAGTDETLDKAIEYYLDETSEEEEFEEEIDTDFED